MTHPLPTPGDAVTGRSWRAWVDGFGPWNAREARLGAAWMFEAGGWAILGATLVSEAMEHVRPWGRVHAPDRSPWEWLVAFAVIGSLFLVGQLLRRTKGLSAPIAIALPLVGTAMQVALNLVTHDATPGAQIMFVVPVVYGAYWLRPAGGLLSLGAVLVALVLTTVTQLPARAAFHDTVYGTSVLVALALVLIASRRTRNRVRAELERRALIDPITGAHQRQVLDRALAESLATPDAAGTALVILDLDRFKVVNDTYGHPVGDAALAFVTRAIRAATRPGDLVCRIGGDELAVLLPGCGAAAAVQRAESMLAHVRDAPMDVTGTSVSLSLSAGVAHAPTHATDVEALYAASDDALYRAKRAGRDRVVVAL